MPKCSLTTALTIYEEDKETRYTLNREFLAEEERKKYDAEFKESLYFTAYFAKYCDGPDFSEKVNEDSEVRFNSDTQHRRSGRRYRRLMAKKHKAKLISTAKISADNYGKRCEDCMHYTSQVRGRHIYMVNHPICRVTRLMKKAEKISS